MPAKAKKPESKASKIINIVVMVIEILVIIASIALSIAVITGSKVTEKDIGTGYSISVVLSKSMDGTYKNKGYSEELGCNTEIGSFDVYDLVIVRSLKSEEKENLKVGDVVMYSGIVNGEAGWITHRIVDTETLDFGNETKFLYYYTQGDAEVDAQRIRYGANDMAGVVVGVVPKIGRIIFWLQNSTHFLLSVVIPLALLLVYNVTILIKSIMNARIKRLEEKSKQDLEAMKANIMKEVTGNDRELTEEEIKKKAIEEYLANLNKTENVETQKDEKIE